MRIKNPILLSLRQTRKQWQHLGVAQGRLMAEMFAQCLGCLADLAFTGQKNQDVTVLAHATGAPQLIDRVADRVVQVVVAAFLERSIALLDREHAARHHDHRCRSVTRGEMVGKTLGVDCGRGDNDLQVRSARQNLAQVTEQKVNVQAALVRLVDDQRVVSLEQWIGLGFRQQDSVGHQLDRGFPAQSILEPHLEPDHFAQRRLQFLRNPFGD